MLLPEIQAASSRRSNGIEIGYPSGRRPLRSARERGFKCWMSGIISAFLGGLLSFVSPCVLPLVPPYLCFHRRAYRWKS
jgi:cytochrome c biogenesis protein CcdA